MAIIINDNFAVNVGKPIDSKYLNISTPWTSIGTANANIPLSYRYIGLTVNINDTEYWYKNGVTNTDLVLKIATGGTAANAVTGATNIGYFSGKTGVQVLPITNLPNPDYNGNYSSLYNYYYRGTDGNTHIGVPPSDGIPRRGYIKTTPLPVKSWLWNEYTGGGGNLLGWILVDGNISQAVGTFQTAYVYYPPSTPYTQSGWTTGNFYNNSSDLIISTVLGSLLTGTTLTIGGRPYAKEVNNILDFRTIISDTPSLVKVWDDEANIHLSGSTGNQLITASNGLTKTGQNVSLGGTLTGTTIITDATSGQTGIVYGGDYRATFVDNSLVSKCYVDSKLLCSLGGERIFKTICQSHSFVVNDVVGFSGGTYNKAIANGTYDGEVIGIVTKCFCSTAFEVTQAGYVSGLTPVFTMNDTYFLSASVPGSLTNTEPIVPNYISKSMLIATSSSTGWVLPYAGYIITSGVTGGALIKNVSISALSTYYVKPTDFYIGVSGGTQVWLQPNVNGLATCGTMVVIADIGGNASCACPILINGPIYGYPTAEIDTCYGSLSFIYNGIKWNVVAFPPAIA
jgi:hypothetical protein